MRLQRRALIRSLFTAAAVLAVPRWLFAARPDAAFDADNSETVVSDLFDGPITESDQVTLKVPGYCGKRCRGAGYRQQHFS